MTLTGGKAPLILIVDDESGITAMLADRLSFAGYASAVAENAERAMDLIRQREPDLILTDLYMPKIDGSVFIQQLRDEGFDIPVILMSAGIEGEIAALRAQCVGFLEKPFDMNRAIDEVERALDERAATR